MWVKLKKRKRLRNVHAGAFFLYGATMGFKSEYRTSEGAIEAYIVGSGEMFWGGVTDPQDQANLWVYEIKFGIV